MADSHQCEEDSWAGGGKLLCAECCEGRRCQETLAGGAGAPTPQEESSRGRGR